MTTSSRTIEHGSGLAASLQKKSLLLHLPIVLLAVVLVFLSFLLYKAELQREKWRSAYASTFLLQAAITGCLESHQGRIDPCDSFEKVGTEGWQNDGLKNVNVTFVPNSVDLFLTMKNDDNDRCQVTVSRLVVNGSPRWKPLVSGGTTQATLNDFLNYGDWFGMVACSFSHTGFMPASLLQPLAPIKGEVRREWVCPTKNAEDCRFLPVKELL